MKARATMVDWTRITGGTGLLRIDEGDEIRLDRGQADLLEVLLEDRGEATDGLIDWKGHKHVLLRVGCKSRKKVTPGALRTRTHRLRDALERAGHSRWLVQCHAARGMRFALRRSS